MQGKDKTPAAFRWLTRFPRFFIILGLLCAYLFCMVSFAPQVSAASLGTGTGEPGSNVSDPVVRQVDIAQPAVVRIVTEIGGQLTVHFTSSSAGVTFPQGGGTYNMELSGSGAFISAHGDLLTADHVVNPPHDDLDGYLHQLAAQDVADYINAHYNPNPPFVAADAQAVLDAGEFPSTSSYGQASSEVFLSTAYVGAINATKLKNVPANVVAKVDRIEAQSAVEARDVAIIHVSGMDDMPSIQLGNSDNVQAQDNLTLIGYPGLADLSDLPTNLLTPSINKIYVSALKTTDSGAPVIEVGGNVEHGDSGGPALDANGNIVGIVSFGYASPGEIGETSFLQASNSAKTLIDSLNLNTAPGPFETAWTKAFNDYASSTPGHWHKASNELQGLATSYKNFLGVTPYLTYAQNQAATEQTPATTTGANPVLIVLLILLVLIILAVVVFVIVRQRRRPALAGYGMTQSASVPYGAYAQQPGGVASMYPPTPASYGAQSAPVQGPGSNGVPDMTRPFAGNTPVSYPPTPASYGDSTWREQAASLVPATPQSDALVPQTPRPVVSQPLPPLSPVQGETSVINSSLPSGNNTTIVSSRPAYPALPTWTSPQAPEPASFAPPATPVSETASVAQPAVPAAEATLVVPPVAPEATPAPTSEPEQSASPVLISGSLSETWSKSAVYSLSSEQAEAMSSGSASVAGSSLPASTSWPAITTLEDDKTIQAPAGSARTFSVPHRPSTPLSNSGETQVASPVSAHTWTAPCGHVNSPDVRFCRVCGQPTGAASTQDGNGTPAS